jgi:hypothetical protein
MSPGWSRRFCGRRIQLSSPSAIPTAGSSRDVFSAYDLHAYGAEQWPGVPCIDFWVYLDHDKGQCRLSVEGWNLPELILKLSGNSFLDGAHLADVFAMILGVRSPRL